MVGAGAGVTTGAGAVGAGCTTGFWGSTGPCCAGAAAVGRAGGSDHGCACCACAAQDSSSSSAAQALAGPVMDAAFTDPLDIRGSGGPAH